VFALADCNNFFVSCERVFRPDLQGRPVLVLSGNDGCVVSRSNEVKRLGIKMGVPFFEIQEQVTKYDIACFSSNFSLYGDLSSRVMSLLSSHTTRLDQYSIDEAFLDLNHLSSEAIRPECESMVREVRRGVGIPISIGVAPSKTLAKVASKYAKQYAGYNGVCVIDSDEKRRKALANFPIGDVWGIGRKSCARLAQAGIVTALQFADCSAAFASNMLNKPGLMSWRELNGEDCINVSELPEKQTITQSRTFAEGVSERAPLETYLSDFTASCAAKLRRQHSVCQQIFVFVETSRFRTDQRQRSIHKCVTLPVPTANTTELLAYVLRAFRADYAPGYPFKRAGVVLAAIRPDSCVQQDLFDRRCRERDSRLQEAIDSVNTRYGRRGVVLGTQLADQATRDLLHSEHLSPRYSTDIRDIITLHC